ncbi:MAG TPA: tyrosine-protein phosphatase [Candidatus Acidoferrum sp.]|nr:tyrosine-protein phosphatase [Candidatus Acidoferrum sp.]
MILRLSFLVLPLAFIAQQGAVWPDKASPSLSSSPQPAFAEKIHISGMSDAGKVNDFLYRGTQPNSEGVEALHKLGVDTIVDLRGEFRGTMETERKRAESCGMHLVSIPGNGWSPPTDKQMAQFFSLIRERPRRKIFIHCWLGGDRTGVFIAAYRITFEGWTPEQAMQEMQAFHFKSFWHPAMKAYVRSFPDRLEHSPALAAFRKIEPLVSR